MSAETQPRPPSLWFGRVFGLVLFFSALTGFAQMPIFKRYYIADIPGLGWLAEFYVTFTLHHLSAALFLLLGSYALADRMLAGRGRGWPSGIGALKGALLIAIAVTGALLVVKNLPGYRFSPNTIFFLDMGHLGLVMAFLAAAVAGLFVKRPVPGLAATTAIGSPPARSGR